MYLKLIKLFMFLSRHALYIFLVQLMAMQIVIANETIGQKQLLKEVSVDIELSEVSLKEVFQELGKQTDFVFGYDAKWIKTEKRKFNLNIQQGNLQQALEELSKEANVHFKRLNNNILVVRDEPGQTTTQVVVDLADVDIQGKITDETGEGLPGASVVLKGTTRGTTTDLNGNYRLTIPEGSTIVISFVGFVTKEIVVGNQSTIDLQMELDAAQLEEVVVVGYGSQKKSSVVGAISTISNKDIVTSPTSNLSAGLAGKMPGLTIMMKDGELGRESMQTLIRGQATMNSSAPLVLVDGVEREISTIDPYDIDNISILKDASATAVFGVRGANGVILVTTKKGEAGPARITANVNYSLQKPTRLPDPMNAIDYMNTRNAVIAQHNAYTGESTPPDFGDEVFEAYANGDMPEYYVDRNFYKEMLHDYVPMMRANVNMSGGTKKTKYFTSVGYMKQGGPFKTERWDEYNYDNEQRLNRFTFRANIDMKINNTLRGWLNLNGYLQDVNDPIVLGQNASSATTGRFYFIQMAAFSDIPSISYPDLNSLGEVVTASSGGRTPYGNLNRSGYRKSTKNQMNTTIGLEQDLKVITEGLSAKVMVSYDANTDHIRGFRQTYDTFAARLGTGSNGQDTVYYDPVETGSELIPALSQRFETNYDLQASLSYSNSFEKHSLSALALYKQEQRTIEAQVPFNYIGVVGRATYDYDSKYFAEFNFGMNGSEQFATGRRFGFFPAFSLGWMLSEENFMSTVGAVDFVKIRASSGKVGNDRSGGARFIYLANWSQGTPNGSYFQSIGGIGGLPNPVFESTVANPLVSWEVADKTNIGIEASFLNNFDLEADVFYEKRSSILTGASLVPKYIYGQLALPATNSGVMENKGYEVTLGYSKKFDNELFIGARLSASFARNKVLSLNETPFDDTFAAPYRVEGYPRGTRFGYDNLGYFKNQDEIDGWADQSGLGGAVYPGDLKYVDQNGDGIVDEKDKIAMDYPNVPERNYSLTLQAQYKGFDMSILLHAVDNYSFDFSGRAIYDWHGNAVDGRKNYFGLHKYAWTAEKAENGGDIRYPRMHVDGVSVSKQPSNYWILDLWYMRLRNMEVGYTLPTTASSKIGLEKLRVYFNGLNMLTWDNMPFKYMDPEVNNSLSHPIFATYNFGMNITF